MNGLSTRKLTYITTNSGRDARTTTRDMSCHDEVLQSVDPPTVSLQSDLTEMNTGSPNSESTCFFWERVVA
jgi:hypothetical protein